MCKRFSTAVWVCLRADETVYTHILHMSVLQKQSFQEQFDVFLAVDCLFRVFHVVSVKEERRVESMHFFRLYLSEYGLQLCRGKHMRVAIQPG